jgi:taurine dioxygenase
VATPPSSLTITPLPAAFGARVDGLDPDTPIDDDTADALRAAMAEHQLLVAHLPHLTPNGQQQIASVFGPLLDESKHGEGYTLVSDREGGSIREGPLLFHSDLAFTPSPLLAISLYAVEVPAGGTATHFANAARAAAQLDDATRAAVADREAVHVYPLTDARGDRRFRVADLDAGAPRATHPVLWERAGAPRSVLFVNAMQTDSIVGLEENESEALIARLWSVLYAADNVYTHSWRVGDLVIWDNIAVQHARDDVQIGDGRTLRRVPVGTLAVSLRPSAA